MKQELHNFNNNKLTVCIQGLGFVGSATAIATSIAKDKENELLYNVIGVDLDTPRSNTIIDKLNRGIFPIETSDINLKKTTLQVKQNGNFLATNDSQHFQLADIVLVCVNVDLLHTDTSFFPNFDIQNIKNAISTLAQYVKPSCLVIVQSTVPPGTCEHIVYPLLNKKFKQRGLKSSPLLAHSYERVMPGKDYLNSITNFWRVYSGVNSESKQVCRNFLESIINTVDYPLSELETTTDSETAKVLENSYRAVNIAFIDEWYKFSEIAKVNLNSIIKAIKVRPTHSNIMSTGLGVGGYCLTKDPLMGLYSSKYIFDANDTSFPFCTQAVEINNNMPYNSIHLLEKILNQRDNQITVLILGVSYRQDVDDTRNSPSEQICNYLIKNKIKFITHDPLVSYWSELNIRPLNDLPSLDNIDVALFCVPHRSYQQIDMSSWLSNNTLIIDTNRVLTDEQIAQVKQKSSELYILGNGEFKCLNI